MFSRAQTPAMPAAWICQPDTAGVLSALKRNSSFHRSGLGSEEGNLPKKLSSSKVDMPVCVSVEPIMPNL